MKKELTFQNSEEIKELQNLLVKIKNKYSVNLFTSINHEELEKIPVNIFAEELSPLSSVTDYLRNKGFSIKDIAAKLNRSNKTIYQSLKHKTNIKKEKQSFERDKSNNILIPIDLFKNRKFSIMEIVISYLHKEKNMKFSEIARLINKDPRTVWTTWNRSKNKNVQLNQ